MASFNGADLGLIFAMNTEAAPKARQVNAYPGANGLQVIDHGSRGGTTVAEGALVSASPAGLAGAIQLFRSLQVDGRPFVLVDTLDVTWSGVILVQFSPVGRVEPVANFRFAKKYQALFLHIS